MHDKDMEPKLFSRRTDKRLIWVHSFSYLFNGCLYRAVSVVRVVEIVPLIVLVVTLSS